MRRLSCFVVAGALLTGGCGGGSSTAPTSPQGPIRLTVQALPVFAGIDSVRFNARVENTGQTVVDLTFPSSCQILPQILNPNGQAVTPAGGGVACATVITSQRLGPGQSFEQSFSVKAGTVPEAPFIVLPPGDYRMVARLDDSTYRLSSDPLPFSLR